jgi:GNAT superfamily N-acetyltransferase
VALPASGGEIVFREATAADLPGITRVRTSVVENHLSVEQLDERGITEASIAASFLQESKGWVAVRGDEIVAFSIADRAAQSIFALFVLPAYEGRGIGGQLLDLALGWLWKDGADCVWLTTGAGTKAVRFYEKRGWKCTGTGPRGDLRYECVRPLTASAG